MKIVDVCEPIFQYICALHRGARHGTEVNEATVRAEVKGIMRQMKDAARVDSRLRRQYDKVDLPLMFFVDYMIKEGNYAFSDSWKELAYEINELAGDEKFFDLLDETMADPSVDATERLEVYYTCMGLGFSGWYVNQPEEVRSKMRDCARRIESLNTPDVGHVCPEAYNYTDERNLYRSPMYTLLAVWMLVLGLIGVVVGGNLYLYNEATQELHALLNKFAGTPVVDYSQIEAQELRSPPAPAEEGN